jgi:Fe/S biogenesis protein NfuA
MQMIQLTERARSQIQALVEDDVVKDPALRIGLAPGEGPRSPLERRYAISLVEREDKERTEIAINLEGIRVLLNLDTSNLLSGATIDWSEPESGFLVETPQPKRAPEPAPRPAGAAGADPLADRVQQVLDDLINPRIAAHGGAVEMVDLADGTLYVRMMGGCQGCAASAATLRQGVERMVREELPEIEQVVDLTDHTSGANPYY